ncbi:hypothetical protein G4D61_03700 [Bacillus ginsengihumi]|uniref:Uncharacterized protein n=1 Tax=Heyndrickxia ginsengihumi TaxID=363870 RepID=A0A0A6VAY7_9BACI|nr:hypothetical protein [Heyndrickxia ginsengihumi]KHD85395.1 hypothetical protein NG54_09430 [Heyndrickxia ginsengihumi]MBE6184878.1 hypothetical protein [Bacillus sp. (in: firmicutes)]MCM3022590.1 hypothetical protein [Heyndrickxia ginsengihumi]NEY19074.1 hypothetical protein [Heyndrickxia ginsengihumi]
MLESKLFMNEKREIDTLLAQGYTISAVTENLSGAFVDFCMENTNQQDQIVKTLHIVTPNGRKYYTTRMLMNKN